MYLKNQNVAIHVLISRFLTSTILVQIILIVHQNSWYVHQKSIAEQNIMCYKSLYFHEYLVHKHEHTNAPSERILTQIRWRVGQRVLHRWSKLSEQNLRFFSKVKILKNAFNKKCWAYRVYISQKKVGVAVIIYF